jgi:hypothetical protein
MDGGCGGNISPFVLAVGQSQQPNPLEQEQAAVAAFMPWTARCLLSTTASVMGAAAVDDSAMGW